MYKGLGQPPSAWQVAYTAETWASSSSSAKWRQGIWCNYYHFSNWTTTMLMHRTVQQMKWDIQKAWGREGGSIGDTQCFKLLLEFHHTRKEGWHQVRKCMLSKGRKLDRANKPTLATVQWAPALLASHTLRHGRASLGGRRGHLPLDTSLSQINTYKAKRRIYGIRGIMNQGMCLLRQ